MNDPRVDITGRLVELRRVDLDTFFRPASVAVVGASDREGTPNASMSRKIRAWAEHHGAAVHYINPNRATVDGFRCHASITDVPGEIDLAAILTGDAVAMFDEVLEKKPRFAVIFAAGFAEVGHPGERLQTDLGRLVAASDTHLLGPNTNLNAFETYRDDLAGRRLALITQSGHQGRPIFQAQQLGLAMSHWAPTGNEVDLEFADFAAWFADQPEIGAIAAYIEGFKDGRTLLLAADHAARQGVPIVCIKVGRTEAGRSMAKSHTGHLTGRDDVIAAAFRQYGITRVRGLDELQDVSAMLCRSAPPSADGICIYAISGGTGAHMADLAAEAGLPLPTLTAATPAALRQWIPDYLRVNNPVDNGGAPSADWRGRKILDAIVADPTVASVICPITGALASMSKPLAQDLVDVAETTDKPICVIWGSPIAESEPAYEILLSSSRVVTVRTFQNAVVAVRAWLDWHRFHRRYHSPFARPILRRSAAAKSVGTLVAGRLTEHEAKSVLAAYGIPVTREEVTGSAKAAAAAAAAIGYPVVLKASSPDLLHKSERGLVRLGLTSPAAVRRAAAELLESAPELLVAEQVDGAGGVECVVGVTQDDLFGPVTMVGLGGVLVEVRRDVTFVVPPFGRAEARRAVAGLRGAALVPDIAALVDVLMRVQRLAIDHADRLAELDINPLLVRPRGQGVVALDALLVAR
ncbi:MAG: acetate--CoA ligase family protein [Acidimicrobiales bacterium]